jgi:RNA polymerase sigma factor (sigma-70 family)
MKSLLTTYLRDISKYRPLTSEQEITLFNQMHLGHQSARDQLICAHLLLVVNIARRYTHPGTDIMDLIQEGNIGLMHAVDIFDPTQGTRFTTYAVYKIHKQIQRFLNKNDDRMISLDINVDNGDENLLLSDTIEDQENGMMEQQFENSQKRMEQEEVKEQLQEKLKTLSSHELQVLRLLYGLDGYPEMSYEEVAQHMGIRADSVRRIKMRAKRKITCPM